MLLSPQVNRVLAAEQYKHLIRANGSKGIAMGDGNAKQSEPPDNNRFRGEFLRSLIFLGVVLAALVGLLQIPPY